MDETSCAAASLRSRDISATTAGSERWLTLDVLKDVSDHITFPVFTFWSFAEISTSTATESIRCKLAHLFARRSPPARPAERQPSRHSRRPGTSCQPQGSRQYQGNAKRRHFGLRIVSLPFTSSLPATVSTQRGGCPVQIPISASYNSRIQKPSEINPRFSGCDSDRDLRHDQRHLEQWRVSQLGVCWLGGRPNRFECPNQQTRTVSALGF